jgi:uncharacterized membrane protein YoaK (UPF0700 family)
MSVRPSRWFVYGVLIAIALFGTVCSLVLQRMFGNQIALISVGPLVCVFGVVLIARYRNPSNK